MIVKKYEISHSLTMNLDQTPLKYIPAMNHTMAKQNSKSVSIAGSSDKRSIIYGGEQSQASLGLRSPMVSC